MKPNWLKERLTPAKQGSRLWGAFTDALQDMWQESVEPVLTRISDRKSLFTMDSADMDTRISEYGRFFVIASADKASRPMLLTQRLDEIHFKGTYQPLEQTFWREFEGLPISWEPLYAPVAMDVLPYGTFFATGRELVAASATYGEFFLTSRGRVVVDLNDLYARYGTEGRDKVVQKAMEDFRNIVAPLIPLHIVYDGLTLQLIVRFEEQRDRLRQETITVSTTPVLPEMPEALTQETEIKTGARFPPRRRSVEPIPVCLDTMPLDCWPLGITAIIPPVIPPRFENDTRLFEKTLRGRAGAPALMLKTLSLFGCLVEYSDGQVVCYGFPWMVAEVVLLPVAGEWRKTIRKVNYLHSIDEVKTHAGLTEEAWYLRVAAHQTAIAGAVPERATIVNASMTTAENTVPVAENAESLASVVTTGQLSASALNEAAEGYVIGHDTTDLKISLMTPADSLTRDDTVSLSGALSETAEDVAITLTDTLNGRLKEVADGAVFHDAMLKDNRTFASAPEATSVLHDTHASVPVIESEDRTQTNTQSETVPAAMVEPQEISTRQDEAVILEDERNFTPAPRSLDPLVMRFDAVPLDAWALGQTVAIPPAFPGRRENDPRLYEKDGALVIVTLDQGGCLIEYATGVLLNVLFPADKAEVVLQEVAGDWRKDIHKITWLSH